MQEKIPYDVVIIGAGLSGIGTAYWLQKKCPGKRFTILESRHTFGGTWDLFRYPGIRSDSDMFTFGFRFKPWQNPKSLSDGGSILEYLKETAEENGIDKKIQYNHQVTNANWSTAESCWIITLLAGDEEKIIRSRFIYNCTGYYSYEETYRPTFEGESDFRGQVVIPQFWPKELDYTGKNVIVVGSGATAVTLVPSMAETAAHVTMLQRSPTYVMTLPNRNGLFIWMKKWLPDSFAYTFTRRMNLLVSILTFALCRAFPQAIKKFIMKGIAKQLPAGYAVDKHFNPSYNPWDQRVCVVPDGDLFTSIRRQKASVVTDHIERFTENGILLQSGEEVKADIIVLATGLKIKLLGGIRISIDGRTIHTNESMIYKGMMVSEVPNLAIAFGYTNNSWTLKTDLTANYICKLLNYMDKHGYQVVIPGRENDVTPEPFMNFKSGYIHRADAIMPKQGSRRPWRVYQNYLMDAFITRFGKINDGVLEFR